MTFNFAQRISVVAATVALATLVPGIAFSQSTRPSSSPTEQPANSSSNNRRSLQEVLNLSPEQMQQIRQIYVSTQQQIEAVLTADQRDKFSQAIQSGQNPRLAIQAMNLSEDQVNRIRSINQSFNQRIQSLLTPQQLRQLQNPNQAQPGNQQPSNQGGQR